MRQKHNEDVFQVEYAENWEYRVRFYLESHSQLQIGLVNSQLNKALYINFVGVEFYDGPLVWRDKGFSVADSAECRQVLLKIQGYNQLDEKFLDEFTLFVVEIQNGYHVRILAGHAVITEENLFSNYISNLPFT